MEKIFKLNIEDNKGSLLSVICAMEDKINEIINIINDSMKEWTQRPKAKDIFKEMREDLKTAREEIMKKVLDRIDKKLDDEEFMKKVEDSLIVEDWRK